MNIHISDEKIIRTLENSTVECFEFGSKLYGLDNKNSDIDDVAIVAQNHFFANSFLWEHHSLQKASPERDTIFTTMQLLVRNLMTGDSVAYFEIINDENCKGTILEFLYDRREWFYNFSTIRAYLGYARRDIKHARESGKRFSHAVRCYYAAKMLFNDLVYYNNIKDYDPVGYQYLHALKNETHDMSVRELGKDIQTFKDSIDSLRKQVGEKFNNIIHEPMYRYMSVERLKEIDQFVIEFSRKHVYNGDMNDVSIDVLYDVLEHGIRY